MHHIHHFWNRRLTILHPLLWVAFSLVTASASNSILLSVDMKGSHKPHAGNESAEEHLRWLEISASSMSLTEPTRITFEWRFYADDLQAKKVIEYQKGSESIDMQPGKAIELKTKAVLFSYVRQHAERVSGGRRANYKRVEATGARYHGWSVRAWMDGKLIAEAYSNRDLSKLVESP